MTKNHSLQSPWPRVIVFHSGLFVGIAAFTLAIYDTQLRLSHPAIALSAQAMVAFWFVATAFMWTGHPGESQQWPRLLWTAGLLMLVVHLVMAFWRGHDWSHASAMRHVAEVGGAGEGIFVSYFFALVWFGDICMMWRHRARELKHVRSLPVVRHAFMAFVMFNATVVFGPNPNRYVYATAWLALILYCLKSWHRALF